MERLAVAEDPRASISVKDESSTKNELGLFNYRKTLPLEYPDQTKYKIICEGLEQEYIIAAEIREELVDMKTILEFVSALSMAELERHSEQYQRVLRDLVCEVMPELEPRKK